MDAWLAVLCGLVSGALLLVSARAPLLGWVALAPLAVAVMQASPTAAGLAGACAAIGVGGIAADRTMRKLVVLAVPPSVLAWGLGYAAAAWAVQHSAPPWVVAVFPATTAVVLLPLRAMGAPRWVNNPLACSQERWLPVVHTARLGGDLTTTSLLALSSAVVALLLVGRGPSSWMAGAGALGLIAGALGAGWWSANRSARRAARCPTARVAAVVADGEPPQSGPALGTWPIESVGYRDVEATVTRYAPAIEQAAGQGAQLIVLPEVCVNVDAASRGVWIDAVVSWARQHDVAIVAPFFDSSAPKNELVLVDARGVVAGYEKQHPAPGMEPPVEVRTPRGPHRVQTRDGSLSLSTVICVDLDYGDLVEPVRAAGGLLAVPANDWAGGFEELHHRTAVWSAVMSGVSTVRATGHGISAFLDCSGRVLARQSSLDGPVVLVADVPLSQASSRGAGLRAVS